MSATIEYRRPAVGRGPVHAVVRGESVAVCGAHPPGWADERHGRPDCPACRRRLGMGPLPAPRATGGGGR